jgi:ElaB/YqjD/DUF883 family membrane-anchored ribosome-binding protein
MEKSVVDKVAKTLVDQASTVGETFRKASQFTSDVAENVSDGVKTAKSAVRDGVKSAKSAVKDGRDAVEDFIDDTARSVKRSPIQSILVAATIGLAVGFLLGRGSKQNE